MVSNWKFFVLIFAIIEVAASLNFSPCPNVFQYGFSKDGSISGLMRVSIPRTKVYGFNVSQEFVSMDNRVNLRKIPQIRFQDSQNFIIESILTGTDVHFVTEFPLRSLEFELVSIKVNGEEVCNFKPDSWSSSSRSIVQTDISFSPPSTVFSLFKRHFKIQLDQPTCGILNTNPALNQTFSQLSHGGEHVDWHLYPWAASVFVFKEYKCSASLITRNTALTAAHCFIKNLNYKNIEMKLYNGKMAPVWGYLNHEDHDLYKNDISLVFLEDDITDADFSPVCVDRTGLNVAGLTGDLVSFGENEIQQVGQIAKISLPAVSNEDCKVSNSEFRKLVEENHFCAGNRDGSGPCDGDSGGGWSTETNGKWYLRGILSTGLKNKNTELCDNYNYAIFMNVGYFTHWITNEDAPVKDTPVASRETSGSLIYDECGDIADSSPKTVLDGNGDWMVYLHDRLDESKYVVAPVSPRWIVCSFTPTFHLKTPERYYVGTKDGLTSIDIDKFIVHEKYNSSQNNRNNIILVKLKGTFPSKVTPFCIDKERKEWHGNKPVNAIWIDKKKDELSLWSTNSLPFEKCDDVYWLQGYNWCTPYANVSCNIATYEGHRNPESKKSYWKLTGFGAIYDEEEGTCMLLNPVTFYDWIQDTINAEENHLDRPAITEECGDFGNTRETPDYTWAVRLYDETDTYSLAVLISPWWVICDGKNKSAENLYIKKITDGRSIRVAKNILHEKYDENESYSKFSISLVKLKEPLTGYKVFCIDHLASRLESQKLYGLGFKGEGRSKIIDLTILPPAECSARTGNYLSGLSDDSFCVPDENDGNQCVDIAFDSHTTADGKSYWTVVGIASAFKTNDDTQKKTCYYTDFAYYIDWIKDKMSSN